MNRQDEALLSKPESKEGRLQRACLDLLREHARAGDIPTNIRFLYYELEQRGVVPKKYDGFNPKTGEKFKRTPSQDISRALMNLREIGLVPWHWLTDETCTLRKWRFATTVLDYLLDTIAMARIDLWDGEEPPLILCESRATAGVLDDLGYEYLCPTTSTGGQSGGFIVTEIVPLLRGRRQVLYIGDYEERGPADQIEANTKRVIEKHTGRIFGPDEWVRIALTKEQVNRSVRLQKLKISKLDNRYKPPKRYEAVECEALGQGVLVRLIRRQLERMLQQRGLPPIEEVRAEEERQRQEMKTILDERRRRS